uniref:Pentatricopeptide repeat-containing protein n=1 Tax=Manihot esculenta TaxID=3983 RepID=A0A2C9VR87_MANES
MFNQIPSLLQELAKSHQTLSITKQLHASITRAHLAHDSFYATKILRFYALNNDLRSACNLFDKTPQRSVFLWNSFIRAFARAHKFNEALLLYTKMLGTPIKPDNFTYACLIRACHENFDLDGLRLVHGGLIVSGLGLDSVSCSALVTAYSKMGLVSEARQVFSRISEPDLVLWNSLISGYVYCEFWAEGLRLFNGMRENGKQQPDGYTFVGIISGLMDFSLLGVGLGIHGLCLKSGFDCNAYVGSALDIRSLEIIRRHCCSIGIYLWKVRRQIPFWLPVYWRLLAIWQMVGVVQRFMVMFFDMDLNLISWFLLL